MKLPNNLVKIFIEMYSEVTKLCNVLQILNKKFKWVIRVHAVVVVIQHWNLIDKTVEL
jgi:hypothetical protein